MAQSSVMDKLAWRAKWRRRWHQWKTIIFIIAVLIVVVPLFTAFTPWAPQMVRDAIEQERLDSSGESILPAYAERLFKMGMFYSITLRDDEALRCWDDLCTAYTGYNIRRWAADVMNKSDRSRKEQKERKKKFSPEAACWVGYSLYEMGQYLDRKKHKQQAKKIYEFYLEEFKGKPYEDLKATQNAEIFLLRYGAGG